MAAAQPFNPRSPTMRRIMREAKELTDSPSADYTAAPLDSDIFEWHFTIRGPPNSAFSEGMYHGRIVLPAQYPLRPPNFRFTTPSGRFEVNREICLSISGFHEETWQPAWGIRTALVALRSFMETSADGQVGGIDASDSVKRSMAAASPSFRCATCRKTNAEIMSECEAAAAKHSGSSTPLVEVPSELKLAFKDELTSGKKPITDQEKEDADEEARYHLRMFKHNLRPLRLAMHMKIKRAMLLQIRYNDTCNNISSTTFGKSSRSNSSNKNNTNNLQLLMARRELKDSPNPIYKTSDSLSSQ
ncbi:Ubiquitin-conjugating enzyme E2 J1 [Ceratocystis platani]|uniref:Ubiquitin-conjugating enzyme E2 J1 n=1 Tax=Ceratocystis fimbriata f. sp. platani TaxID=88771 RepID=A0A0F8DFM6_CERFI|nr:Ubiquitin-conjugating enzyme E2 J1 [Ceratocystis platani]